MSIYRLKKNDYFVVICEEDFYSFIIKNNEIIKECYAMVKKRIDI